MPISKALIIGGIAGGGLLLMMRRGKNAPGDSSQSEKLADRSSQTEPEVLRSVDTKTLLGDRLIKKGETVEHVVGGEVIATTTRREDGTSVTTTEQGTVMEDVGFIMHEGDEMGCNWGGETISCDEFERRLKEATESYAPDLVI